jgi:hypothetical protein
MSKFQDIYNYSNHEVENVIRKIILFLLFMHLLVGGVQAGVGYGDDGKIYMSAPYTYNDLPSLYTSLVAEYNVSYIQANALNESSPGVWRCARLLIPVDCPFYINSSTCTELRLMNANNMWAMEGYPIINNTKIIGWNKVEDRPNTFTESGHFVMYTAVHDVDIENFDNVNFGYEYGSTISNLNFYNVSTRYLKKGVCFLGNNLTVDNLSVVDGHPVSGNGLYSTFVYNSTFSNIYIDNVSDPMLGSSGAYGIQFFGSDDILKDVYINGTSWSGANIGGADEVRNENITVSNLTMDHAGHNGFEVELNNSTFRNITVSRSAAHNIFQVGREEAGKRVGNNIYYDIHSYYPSSMGFLVSEGSFNTTICNSTLEGKGLYFNAVENITAINCTQKKATGSGNANLLDRYADTDAYRHNDYSSLIDCILTNNTNLDLHIEHGDHFCLINTNYSKLGIINADAYGAQYYYTDILVKSPLDSTKNITISINCENNLQIKPVNGYGKNLIVFPTSDGRSYLPSDNRVYSPAIAEYYINQGGYYSLSHRATITSPDGRTVSLSGITPDSSWYRKDPNVPTYTITAIIPSDSKGTHITGFAPSTENPFNPGEKKTFRVWTDGNLTGMKWLVYNDYNEIVDNKTGVLNYTWTVSKDVSKIEFSGVDANGNKVPHTWYFGDESGDKTTNQTTSNSPTYIGDYYPIWDTNEDGIVDILDITSIARHYGEIYTNKPYPRGDVNQDGVINIQDLYLAGDHFGETVN